MLSTKRKNNVVIMAILVFIMSISLALVCGTNVAKAEEISGTNVVSDIESYAIDMGDLTKDRLQVAVKGSFKDGDRLYAEFYMTVSVFRKDESNYEIKTLMKVNPLNWKTDKYRIDRMAYGFYGENVELTSRKIDVYENSKKIKEMNKTGFATVDVSFAGDKANNYPYIEETIQLKKTGLGKLTMHFTALEVKGILFAKNTKINSSIAKIMVQPSPFMGAYPPVYYYSGAYIKDAAYTTQFGPVPTDWKIVRY